MNNDELNLKGQTNNSNPTVTTGQQKNNPGSTNRTIGIICLVLAVILFIISSFLVIEAKINPAEYDYGGGMVLMETLILFAPFEIILSSLFIFLLKKSKIWLLVTILFPILIKFVLL